MKKRLGVSFPKTKFENYWNWFTPEDLQNEVELVKLSYEQNNTEDIYTCDGFILTGGVDIEPSLYKGAAEYENSPGTFEPDRDRFEERIFRYSQQNSLPVLGICRGMQLVNVLQGGKLIQDLHINGNKKHRKEDEADKEHAVVATEDSLLYQVTGNISGKINSAHHQAVDPSAIGDNLKINACNNDDENIIEGIEFKDKTDKAFMLCVQWHPERMKDKDENPFSLNIKKRFLQEVKKVK